MTSPEELNESFLPSFGDRKNLKNVLDFIKLAATVCQPDRVELFDGTTEAYQAAAVKLQNQGSFIKLNPAIYPNSFLCRSNPVDVARSEDRTFVCLKDGEKLSSTPNSEIPDALGFKWGCRAGEIDKETGKEMGTEKMRERLYQMFTGCMKGRTMLVIPFSMGPLCSPLAKLGIQISDSYYVATNMYTMTRTGLGVLKKISEGAPFVPCWHSVGCPLESGEKDVAWPCRLKAEDRYISHFYQPDPRAPQLGPYAIMSFGSGYGGNAILGKKCYALRIAMKMARDDRDNVKWLAEHMLILQVTHQEKPVFDAKTGAKVKEGFVRKYTVTAAFPSACGKTNLAMIEVPQEFRNNWSVSCIGDDIAWIQLDPKTKKLRAINPESGFFGVAPGTSDKTNPHAMSTLRGGNIIFTNVAVTRDGDVWWKGLTDEMPNGLIDWKGNPMKEINVEALKKEGLSDADIKKLKDTLSNSAAHPNSRYTTPCSQCPIVDPDWNKGEGFDVDIMLFGGRRTHLLPLAYKANGWNDGVLAAGTLRSEGTAAVQDRVAGQLSFDPFAMRPFIGYNCGEYFQHWIDVGKEIPNENKPDIYVVNWFRKDQNGKFLWEGYGQNFRVIMWACQNAEERRTKVSSSSSTITTPLGIIPTAKDLLLDGEHCKDPKKIIGDLSILEVDPAIKPKSSADKEEAYWFKELEDRKEFLLLLKNDLPNDLRTEWNALVERFNKAGLFIPEGKSVDALKI